MTKLIHSEIERKLISTLSTAKKSISIAVAWFTNPNLFATVLKKREEGIIVHLMLSDDVSNFSSHHVDFQKMINKGVVVRFTKSPRFMHNKFCLIDDRIVISGSYNWTLKAEKLNFENVIISEDPKLIEQFQEYFDHLKFESHQIFQIDQISLSRYEENENFSNSEGKAEITSKASLRLAESTRDNYPEELNSSIDHAEILYREAKLKEGLEYTKAKLIEYPKTPELYLALAMCYWRLGLREEMINYAEKVLVLNNSFVAAHNLIGIGFSEIKNKREKALVYFKKCLESYPQSHEYLVNRGRCLLDLAVDFKRQKEKSFQFQKEATKDYERIEKIVKKTSELNYSDYYSLAIAEGNLGKFTSALKNIATALIEIREEPDIWKRDMNDYREMKKLQYDVKQRLKDMRAISKA